MKTLHNVPVRNKIGPQSKIERIKFNHLKTFDSILYIRFHLITFDYVLYTFDYKTRETSLFEKCMYSPAVIRLSLTSQID